MPDRARIEQRLDALWAIAHGPAGGADRPAFSAREAEAMRLVAHWAAEASLHPAIDPHGNLWALPRDDPADGPLVTSGSHVDTVPDGGRYDGALGTVLALELIADLPQAASSARPALLVCAAEEAPRFGAGTMGSRLMLGALTANDLTELTDEDGITATRAQADYLEALADLPRIDPPLDRVRAHAEVHVAQRWALRGLGVVERVAAPRRLRITVRGRAAHSGETSMEERRDALAAAAEIVLAVEAAARAEPPETVATAATLAVSPNAISVVPGETELGVDMRGIDATSLDRLEAAIRAAADDVTSRRDLEADVTLTRAGQPTVLDPDLAAAALAAAGDRGIAAERTWSGAGHDAQHLAARVPAMLLFVPLHGGESHTPREGADLDEILGAAEVVQAVMAAR